MLYQILIASIIGSLFALIGGVLLLWKEKFARRISLTLISFAVGSLLGAALLDLLPEALNENTPEEIFPFVILGLIFLFLFEKWLKWYHCHDREVCDLHTFSGTILVGDAIHNFIDGIIIAASFGLGVEVGIATTVAVFLHEIPQEISDFGVLLHAGWKKKKILFYNVLTALATIVGAVIAYFTIAQVSEILPFIAAFASGIFLYIAVSDLMPELRHKTRGSDLSHVIAIILGILSIYSIGLILGH